MKKAEHVSRTAQLKYRRQIVYCFILAITILPACEKKNRSQPEAAPRQMPTRSVKNPDDDLLKPAIQPANLKTNPPPALSKPGPALSKSDLIQELKNVRTVPASSISMQFSPADEAMLLTAYRSTEHLPQRIGLIWTLSRIGGEETTKTFINTLTNEFIGRTLKGFEIDVQQDEVNVMRTISFCMGFLAQRDDKAWKFLQQAVEPSYWQQAIGWKSSMGVDVYGLFAGSSIHALGATGRKEVPELLQRLRKSPPQETAIPEDQRDGFEGAIVQAAYYSDLLQEKGVDGFCLVLADHGHL